MRNIKTYKIFENILNIVDTIKELSLEITDMGFSIDVKAVDDEVHVKIFLPKPPHYVSYKYFYTDDIKDFILRLYQYMSENKYKSSIEYVWPGYSNEPNIRKRVIIRPDDRFRYLDTGIEPFEKVASIFLKFYI